MRRVCAACLCLGLCLLLITGCADRTELNELAIELGWGMDQEQNKSVQVSTQVIIPSELKSGQNGGGGKAFFVASGTGSDTMAAVQNMQAELSRRVFRGQRRVIVIGEDMARRGLADFIDTYSRDPEIRLRANMFVVQGGTAKEFLNTPSPLENIPAVGASKEWEQLSALADTTLLNFILATATEGSSPTLPAIEVGGGNAQREEESTASGPKGFHISGVAIFSPDLKLVGFLNVAEAQINHWVAGDLKNFTVTGMMPNEGGNVSVEFTQLKSQVEPVLKGSKITLYLTLTGKGIVRENNTQLNLTQSKNIKAIESELNKQTTERVLKTIQEVQNEYGTDIFGFNGAVYRKYPVQWEKLKNRWEQEFSKADVVVNVKLTVRRVGLTGPSLQLRENEVRK